MMRNALNIYKTTWRVITNETSNKSRVNIQNNVTLKTTCLLLSPIYVAQEFNSFS